MQLLLTEDAAGRVGERIRTVAPGVALLCLHADGSLSLGGEAIDREDAAPEVAWLTGDLFRPGAPVRPFFGLAMRAPSLRWLQTSSAGVDAPVFGDLVRRSVTVTTTHVQSVPIAEFVLRAVLDHFQRAGAWRQAQAEGEWRRHDFREVHGTTWLVIGYGAIGAAVATRAQAFGARVVAVRRRPTGTEPVDEVLPAERVLQGVPRADVVVLAAPLTGDTRHLVDERFLASMRPRSVLVNVGRGGLVDEEALLAALERGVPDHAALDVFATEPLPPGHPFWNHPRVAVTPHGSAHGDGVAARGADAFLANLARYVAGEPLDHVVTEADLAQS